MQVDKAGESSYPFIGCVFWVLGICLTIVVITSLAAAMLLSVTRGPGPVELEEIERAIEAANSGRK